MRSTLKLSKALWLMCSCAAFYFCSRGAGAAAAQPAPPDGISVEGLHFRCSGCSSSADGKCRIPFEGTFALLECPAAAGVLLRALERSGSIPEYPRASELRNYLLSGERQEDAVRNALLLLERAPGGAAELELSAPALYSRHRPPLQRLLSEGWGSEALAARFDAAAGQLIVPENVSFKSVLLLRSGRDGREFYAGLSVVDPVSDAQALEIFAAMLSEARSELRQEVEKTAAVLRSWIKHPAPALRTDAAGLSTAAFAFLEKAAVHVVLSSLRRRPDASPVEILQALTALPYREAHRPGMQAFVLRALEAGAADSSGKTAQALLQPAYGSLLRRLAEDDPQLRGALMLVAGRLASAAGLEAARQAAGRAGLEDFAPAERRSSRSAGAGIAVLLAALVLPALRKRPLTRIPPELRLSHRERTELRRLRRFFGLKPEASLKDLSRAYHEQAKNVHPDAGQGSSIEFSLLNNNYRRAQTLLQMQTNCRSCRLQRTAKITSMV